MLYIAARPMQLPLRRDRLVASWYLVESPSGYHKAIAHLSKAHPGGAVHHRVVDPFRLSLLSTSLHFDYPADSGSSRI